MANLLTPILTNFSDFNPCVVLLYRLRGRGKEIEKEKGEREGEREGEIEGEKDRGKESEREKIEGGIRGSN